MIGTVNRTSSGSPASAVDRIRTAIRSASTAVMPTPPAASSSRPGRFGTGGAYLLESLIPVPTSSNRRLSEAGVGITNSSECRASKTRFRYSSRPATLAARQTATGSVRSRVSAPAAATTITPPIAMANHRELLNSGSSAVEASTQATAVVTVIRPFSVTAHHLRSPWARRSH